jgi:prepilin peptidase CpaA
VLTAMSCAAIAVFVAAAATDLRSRRIPNGLVLALAALGLARIALSVYVTGALPYADLLVALAVFAAGALTFHLGLLGGGDVKLMAAGALWTGAALTGAFLMTTMLAGGVLAAVYLARGRLSGPRTGERKPSTLPYGIAIAAGGVLATRAMLAAPAGAALAQATLSPMN